MNHNHDTNLPLIAAIVGVATLGGFMFGYDSGVINGTQSGLEQVFHLTKAQEGFAVSALLVGCALGAFSAGRLSDICGRRYLMVVAAFLFIVSALIAGAADSATLFIIARILGGIGVGAASVLSPTYISEVAPAPLRGRLSSVQQIMIIAGLTGAFVVNYGLAEVAGGSTAPFWLGYAAWRWMFWMQALPATLFLGTLLLIPESPRYLVAKNRHSAARSVLTRLFGTVAAARKVAEIRESLGTDHAPRLADLRDPVTGRWRRIVWIGIGLAAFQQLVGINTVFYYGAVLWQAVGFTEADALKINVLSGGVAMLACMVAIGLIDRIGRKPLLLFGSFGMTIALTLMVVCFASAASTDGHLHISASMGRLALIAAVGYSFLFNLSWGPVMWVMLGEMFPNQIRGSGLAISGAVQWICNFLISASFPTLAAWAGLPITYGCYAFFAFMSIFFVGRMVQETKGIELEQMIG